VAVFLVRVAKTLLSYDNPGKFNSDSGQVKPYGTLDASDQQPTPVVKFFKRQTDSTCSMFSCAASLSLRRSLFAAAHRVGHINFLKLLK